MNSIRESEKERPRGRVFVSTLQRASLVLALTLCAALPSYAWTWYSGASVGSDGTVYGWGVTDVTAFPMYHVAYVSTTLTSPVKKRQAASGWVSAQNSVRADVSLAFDPDDLGTYEDDSENEGYCYTSMGWFLIEWTEAPANDAPARLVPYDYPPCAPEGVGPLQVLNNQSVVDCAGNQHASAFDGVNRNLVYQLVDGTGAAYPGAYSIAESFSNFEKTPSNSGLGQPTATNADIPAGGLVIDCQYAGYTYPSSLGSNEHASYTQNFTVTVGGTANYPLTTTVSISLGNFNGTPEDNVTITTP